MGRWGEAANMAQGPSDYIQLVDGTEVTIRVLTDPVVQNKTFQSDPDNPKTVFSWIVWDYTHNAPKILSKSGAFAKRLDFISEKWGDEIPMKCDIVIETTGTKLNTKYELAAIPPTVQLPPDWQAQVANIDLDKLLPNHIPIQAFIKGDGASSFPTDAVMASNPNTQVTDTVITDIGDEPINLDDIPFQHEIQTTNHSRAGGP